MFLKPYYTTWDAPLTICVHDAVICHLPKVLQQRDFAAGCRVHSIYRIDARHQHDHSDLTDLIQLLLFLWESFTS